MTTSTAYDWNRLIATSEYEALVAIRDAVRDEDLDHALEGLEELIEAVASDKRKTVRSHLRQLMAHILKWQVQPQRRSRSWSVSILNARQEIEDILEGKPSITDEDIREMWDDAFRKAQRLASAETGLQVTISNLTWQEVFDEDYLLLDE